MAEILDESRKLHKDLFFWVCNFHGFLWVRFYFFFICEGIMKNVWAEIIHVIQNRL